MLYDGFFTITQNEEGVFLELFPPAENGQALSYDEIVKKLKEDGVEGYDADLIQNTLANLTENTTINIKDLAAAKRPTGSLDGKNYRLRETADHMKLMITLYHPETPGDVVDLSELELEARKLKIILPIDKETLSAYIEEEKYNEEFPLIKGQYAINQKPDFVEYHFKTEKDFTPEVDEQGNVNYHKLNVIANVKKDQHLATLHPGEKGQSGINIFGKELKPAMPKKVVLRRGKNVKIDSTNTKLFAEVDGLVKLDDGRVIVNNTYEVPNHVGTSTGDIEFEGSVVVHGNVMTGFKVKAKGDIEVMGVVEGANVEAGGNIILHRGIQGMSNCKIVAGGNLQARYIENADVVCGGNIHSEAILHSSVTAKEEILVEGKKGMISGGTVRSGTEIKSNILGSHMGTVTNVEVGVDPFVWEEYNKLIKELPKMKEESTKLEQVIALLGKRKELEGSLDEQKQAMFLSATRNKIFMQNKVNLAEKRIEELKEQVERRNDGQIITRNIIYPGVRVTIGTAKMNVKGEIKYVKLYKDGADVRMTSL